MRLIDADEFVAELIFLYEDRGWHEREIHFSLADMRCNVDIISTVDAVEVVRCKDCKWHEYEEVGLVWCPIMVGSLDGEDGYCSWGERREDETN